MWVAVGSGWWLSQAYVSEGGLDVLLVVYWQQGWMHDRRCSARSAFLSAFLLARVDSSAFEDGSDGDKADVATRHGRERDYSVDMEIASNPWEMIEH